MSLRRQMEEVAAATADLVKRSGAFGFELGYLHDGVPVEQAGWFALANYGINEIKAEGRNPIDACHALAIELLDGSVCRRCARPITVFGNDDTFCGWHIEGNRWISGCGKPIDYDLKLGPKAAA